MRLRIDANDFMESTLVETLNFFDKVIHPRTSRVGEIIELEAECVTHGRNEPCSQLSSVNDGCTYDFTGWAVVMFPGEEFDVLNCNELARIG